VTPERTNDDADVTKVLVDAQGREIGIGTEGFVVEGDFSEDAGIR